MRQDFFDLIIKTKGQNLYEFTHKTIDWIKEKNFNNGVLNLSIQHTSASLIVQENADPDVQTDLLNYFDKMVPMDNKLYIHTTEGKDDMPAHIKSALTNNQISLSKKKSHLLLGTWQGLYLFEQRIESQERKIVHHFQQKCAFNPPKKYAGSILDGRDITSIQMKDAMFKFYITANLRTRSVRRYKEYKNMNKHITLKEASHLIESALLNLDIVEIKQSDTVKLLKTEVSLLGDYFSQILREYNVKLTTSFKTTGTV